MAKKQVQIIGLNDLELTNNDIFVRKTVDEMDVDSRVIVFETHNAILLKNGVLQDTLSAGDYPLFDKKVGLFSNTKIGSFTIDLIYVSKTAELKVFWGTPNPFDFRDPVTRIPVKVGASGEFGVKVANPRQLYCELIGAQKEFSIDDLKERLRGRLLNEIEPVISRYMRENALSYSEITEHKQELAKSVLPSIQSMFEDSYGLKVTYFIISNIVISDEDKRRIEDELNRVKAKAEDRDDYKWWVEEYERLADKKYEREKLMKDLEREDYAKYLDVCKLVGWNGADKSGGKFCTKCGAPCSDGDAFCSKCGNKLGADKSVCLKCGKEVQPGSAFCPGCGTKL